MPMPTQSQGGEGFEGAFTVAGNGMRSLVIEAAEVQASLQPWFEMECYQLGRGNQLAQVDLLDLGSQQFVRESQNAAIHKIGKPLENLCTVSCCTPQPGSRLSEFSSAAAAVFFLPGNTEFDIYVPAGASTTHVSFDQDQFLWGHGCSIRQKVGALAITARNHRCVPFLVLEPTPAST
jgi:hypothetical protein